MLSTKEIHGSPQTRPTLVVDVGNSDSVFGLFLPDEIVKVVRVPSKDLILFGEEQLSRSLANLLYLWNLKEEEAKCILISSVVPTITAPLSRSLVTLFRNPVVVLEPSMYPSLSVEIPLPEEMGSDLVANAVHAAEHVPGTCIIVDFGTALTYTAVDDKKVIRGVAIAPGIRTSMMALASGAARLPEIKLKLPDSALGQNTIEAIQSGILFGYTGMVKEVLSRMKKELPSPCYVIATGGLVGLLPTLEPEFDEIDPFLTLKGLKKIADKVA